MSDRGAKPLGGKAYGHIPHLPQSRMGSGDHSCAEGQAAICTEKPRDRHDVVIVQEKLDGSCVAVANVGGEILALGRAGYLAQTSPYPQHQLFAAWVRKNEDRFRAVLPFDGERLAGEWLAQAHGTRYNLPHEPFVAFDLMRGMERALYAELQRRVLGRFTLPALIALGPTSVEKAMGILAGDGFHGATEQVEGAIWRVERLGKVDIVAKFVRPDKADGCYLPEVTAAAALWHVEPSQLLGAA